MYFNNNRIKARVNKDGLMNSATRIEQPKKGKGSFRRKTKYAKSYGGGLLAFYKDRI
jgi:stalled ribosome alternative rescue factor ArfA